MDQLPEVTFVKIEPIDSTTSCQVEIPNEVGINPIKEESECLDSSEIYIKTEVQDDDDEVIRNSSYGMCPKFDLQNEMDDSMVPIEMDEPMVPIEYENLFDESAQDPLDANRRIKVAVISEENKEMSKKTQSVERNKEICKDKKFICHVCHKTFNTKGSLKIHLPIHADKKPFTCSVCKRSFTQRGTLTSHMLIHTGEKPRSCDICGKNFRSRSTLHSHKLTHSDVKPYSCNLCSKSFQRRPNLTIHLRLHTNERPFACDVCHKAYKVKSLLTLHKSVHTGEKPYSCDVCHQLYAHKTLLHRHKKYKQHY